MTSEKIFLDKNASHHLANVLRAKVGENITLFNGQGGEYHATISAIHKKNVEVEIGEWNAGDVESPLTIHLAQGISRGEKMDFTIQKAVELGVNKIFPLFTERSNVKLDKERSEKKWEHWRSVISSACEQSGRNTIPELSPVKTLENALPAFDQTWRLVLSPHQGESLKTLPIQKNQKILLLIGPEGGLSESEINKAVQQGFHAVNLGPRVLRTETAGIVAITALQCLFGDM
jgi:16S rRNA (uracil1498-N3)-methyltransferase